MKSKLIIFAMLVAFASPAFAQVALTITDNGYFQTEVDTDGKPISIKIEKILDLRTGSSTPTIPPVDTPTQPPFTPSDPTNLSAEDKELLAELQSLAAVVDDPQGALSLAMVYAYIKGALDKGKTTDAQAWKVVPLASDAATANANWSKFRAVVGERANTRKTAGKLNSSQYFAVVQYALEKSADGTYPDMAKLAAATIAAETAMKQVIGGK